MVYLFFFWISITHSYFNLIHFHTCNSLWLVLRMLCAANTWLSILHCCSTAWKLNHGAEREEWGEVCISNPRLWLKAELWYSWHCSTYVCWVLASPQKDTGRFLTAAAWSWAGHDPCHCPLSVETALSGKVFSDSAACHRTGHNERWVKAWCTQAAGGRQEALLGSATPALAGCSAITFLWVNFTALCSRSSCVPPLGSGFTEQHSSLTWWELGMSTFVGTSTFPHLQAGHPLTMTILSPEVMDGLYLKTACGCPLAVCQGQDVTKDYQCSLWKAHTSLSPCPNKKGFK